jgi:SOUL heme-binding protein
MTAPVAQERNANGAWVIRFFMPSRWTLDTLPRPDRGDIRIVTVAAERVAVLRFTGARDADAVASKTAELIWIVGDSECEVAGQPAAWFYDPPWTLPWRRRNEIAVPVAAPGG